LQRYIVVVAAAPDIRGRGSLRPSEEAKPDEVVMASAQAEPDFVG